MKIKIQTISAWNLIATVLVVILFACVYGQGEREFQTYQEITEQYFLCKDAAIQLQEGSDYLTEQVRLYVLSGEEEYLEAYLTEVNQTQRREKALSKLAEHFSETKSFLALQAALENSRELMETEYYAMRLLLELSETKESTWPEEVKQVELPQEDLTLTAMEKLFKAQDLVSDRAYQEKKQEISQDVLACTEVLLDRMKELQQTSEYGFSDSYKNLPYVMLPMAILMFGVCFIIKKQVVQPLCEYGECIREGKPLPVIGAVELRNLAETYNHISMENEETQEQLRYQAEHDALTKLFNRGSFDRILQEQERKQASYSLILIDVDYFKQINDTYGHAVGDQVLKKVASLLQSAFRTIDFICRVGGDEFAVIMVDTASSQKDTIRERIKTVNDTLQDTTDDLPSISLSVGVAFSDREDTNVSIFTCADDALYYVKEHGKNGCVFH